jgi:hypothetical protein
MNRLPFPWLISLLIIVVLVIISIDIPFLWDTTWHSAVAGHFFHFGTGTLMPPAGLDNGNPPLYPLLIGLSWLIGGYKLASAHIFFALVLLTLMAALIALGRKFIPQRMLWMLPILLLADPAVLTQSLLMGYDLLILSIVLWSLVFILNDRPAPLFLLLPLLLMIHTRAIPAFVMLLLVQLIRGGKGLKSLIPYFTAAAVLVVWHSWHYLQSGWILIPPGTDSAGEDPDLSRWLRQAAYVIWRSLDLGRIGLWIAAAIIAWQRRRSEDQEGRILLILAVLPLLIHILAFSHADLPVSPRYFMLSQVMLMLYFLKGLRDISFRKTILAYGIVLVCLSGGHLWHYPERFGQSWDSQLSFMPWPDLEQKLDQALASRNLERTEVAALYPLTYSPAESRLEADTSRFSDLAGQKAENFNFVLVSNFSNMYEPELRNYLRENWVVEWTESKGRIEIVLYRNPNHQLKQASHP